MDPGVCEASNDEEEEQEGGEDEKYFMLDVWLLLQHDPHLTRGCHELERVRAFRKLIWSRFLFQYGYDALELDGKKWEWFFGETHGKLIYKRFVRFQNEYVDVSFHLSPSLTYRTFPFCFFPFVLYLVLEAILLRIGFPLTVAATKREASSFSWQPRPWLSYVWLLLFLPGVWFAKISKNHHYSRPAWHDRWVIVPKARLTGSHSEGKFTRDRHNRIPRLWKRRHRLESFWPHHAYECRWVGGHRNSHPCTQIVETVGRFYFAECFQMDDGGTMLLRLFRTGLDGAQIDQKQHRPVSMPMAWQRASTDAIETRLPSRYRMSPY